MSYRMEYLGDGRMDELTDGRTDAGNDNTLTPKLALGNETVLLHDNSPPDIPREVSGCWRSNVSYHVITQFCFYLTMSKLKNSTDIFPWFWINVAKISETHNVLNVTSASYSIVMSWQWCWQNVLFLMTAWQLATSTAGLILLTTKLNCGKRVIGKILNARSRANYGQSRDAQSWDIYIYIV